MIPDAEPLIFSRPAAAADSLGDKAPDRHRFTEKKVLLTGETSILGLENGRNCLLNSIRILTRMTRGLKIWIPEGASPREETSRLIDHISFGDKPELLSAPPDFATFDAILSVGAETHSDLPWTTINSNGWVARVSSGPAALSSVCGQSNPVGALAAASLGASEIFKRLIKLVPERAEPLDGLAFSFYSYEVSDDPGPPLPNKIPIEIFVMGVGAIGNGVVHLLNSLPVSGAAFFVDKQKFAKENLGTCILIGPGDLDRPKAVFAAKLLESKLTTRGFPQELAEFTATTVKELPYPKIVLNGLDEIDPRHSVQSLWPDLIIDGAIGAFSCEATIHPWDDDSSCLYCDFEPPPERSEQLESELTGLREDRLKEMNSVVTEDDVRAAPAEKRPWLSKQVGKEICSVVSEAIVEKLSQEKQKEGFQPSVPFVACLSSCMIVAELVREVLRLPRVLETGFQFDVLMGPQYGIRKAHSRKPSCICVQRKNTIELLRKKHGLKP
jgi:molybdopterin/thiamine biosynthesis adenylyltransferase